jgi:hypothetical protein
VKRIFLHLACAFLLLSAQVTALTHSVWHLHDHLPAQGQHDGAGAVEGHGDDGLPSPQAELCVFHAALGSLFAGGCGAQLTFATAGLPGWPSIPTADLRIARSALTPPSRAPPVLL